mmetsp:Transcript_28596/g.71772  ORF Transcript_28596/g.71772 Transcript_28596/m.71772 type:complete len:107 (+) Transcript_28596:2317-2637(+)
MAIDNNQKIRIKLQSYDSSLITDSCNKIIETIHQTQAISVGPIPLPTKRKRYCVLRSPHVDKDSREHFEVRYYKRVIDIHQSTSQTIDALIQLNLPSGVDIEVKLT